MTKVINNIEIYKDILEQFSISMYQNMYEKIKIKDITLFDFLSLCSKKNDIATQITEIRNYENLEQKQALKLKLPCVTISGTFKNSHTAKGILAHSDLIQLDIDKLENINEVFEKLKHDKYIMCLMISPTGTGLKGIIKIDGSKHNESFLSLENYMLSTYNITIDKQCKDVSRLMFFTHDTEMYINANSEELPLFILTPGAKKVPGTKVEKVQNSKIVYPKNVVECWQFTEQSKTFIEGNRNDFIFQYANNSNRAGINEIEVYQFALDNCSDLKEAEIKASVKSAYKNTADFGTKAYKPLNEVKENVESPKVENVEPIKEPLIKSKKSNVPMIVQVEEFLNDNFDFRKNVVLNVTEYKEKNEEINKWISCNENVLSRKLQHNYFNYSPSKTGALIYSDFVKEYNENVF